MKAEIYDLQTSKMIRNLDGAYQGDALSDVCLSKHGIAACAYAKSASLYFPQYAINFPWVLVANS